LTDFVCIAHALQGAKKLLLRHGSSNSLVYI
jgi:hypothetical protein